jgi:hypothetical protein
MLSRCFLICFLLIIALVLSGCSLDIVASQQEKATEYWPELTGGISYGQSFISNRENLYRIDLGTATYNRINSGLVTFYLKENAGDDKEILSVSIPASQINNDRPTSIIFTPQVDSKGKAFYFYLESQDSTPGDAITVLANSADLYPYGQAYIDHMPVPGDLVFTAYSQENFTFSAVTNEFLTRISSDIPFAIIYGLLLLGILTFFVRSVSLSKKPNSLVINNHQKE